MQMVLGSTLSLPTLLFSGLCVAFTQAHNQSGSNRAIAPPKFLKMYVCVRYINKLHHFAPPKISVGYSPAFTG